MEKKTDIDGGRIDIICQDKNNRAIIIENKIYAGDQHNQLLRYFNFNPLSTMVYLTLLGELPNAISLGNKKYTDFKIILLSYEEDILNWLEQCLKESYQLPVIRETILQYQQTIKKLTNKIEIKEMHNEIANLITESGDKISAALLIEKSMFSARRLLLQNFGNQLLKQLEIKYSDKAKVVIDDSFGSKYQGIKVFPNISSKVFFQFSFLDDFRLCYLEIYNYDNIENNNVKFPKNTPSVSFYKSKLENQFKSPNKIENVVNAWQGDWVCRYFKFDNYLNESGWSDFANSDFTITDIVIMEITPVVDAMFEQLSTQ